MADTTVERRKDALIVYKISELEKDVEALKVNQTQKLAFGSIILDASGSGSLTASNGNVIAGGGLVSATNFPQSNVVNNTTYSTTSSSLVDVPGSTLNTFITTAATTYALITVLLAARNTTFYNTGNNIDIAVVDSADGSVFSFSYGNDWGLVNINFATQSWTTFSTDRIATNSAIVRFNPGTHSLKLRYDANGGGTAIIGFYQFSYLILGTA